MKTPPDNVTCFSLAAGILLGELHEAFPRPVDIHAPSLQEQLVAVRGLPESCAWVEGTACLMGSTLEWLLAEGMVRCEVPAPPLYGRVTLTSKGFSALERPIELPGGRAKPGQTIGHWFREAAHLAGDTALKQAVSQVITHLIPS
jgi:hypothetical protein